MSQYASRSTEQHRLRSWHCISNYLSTAAWRWPTFPVLQPRKSFFRLTLSSSASSHQLLQAPRYLAPQACSRAGLFALTVFTPRSRPYLSPTLNLTSGRHEPYPTPGQGLHYLNLDGCILVSDFTGDVRISQCTDNCQKFYVNTIHLGPVLIVSQRLLQHCHPPIFARE